MLLWVALAFAANTQLYPADPARTPAPLGGLDLVVVDPSTARFTPLPGAPDGAWEVYPNAVPAGDPALVFTNPLSTWAWLSVNGTKVGILGPYATLRFERFTPGWYGLELLLPTGKTSRYAVEVRGG